MKENSKLVLISTNSESLISFKGDLIRDLVNDGFQVIVLSNKFGKETRDKIIKIGAIPKEIYINRLGLNIFKELKAFINLIRIIKEIAPNYVLTYFAKSIILGLLSAKFAGVEKRFAIIEGLGYAFTKDPNKFSFKKVFLNFLLSFLYKISLSQATKIFFLNKDDLKDLKKFKIISENKKAYVLGPIGINLKDYQYTKLNLSENLHFLFIGRLIREKGILEFLKAAKCINSSFPKVKFIVLGNLENANNPGYISYKYIDKLINYQNIIWPGNVNVLPWIQKSSVFVLPSYREGFPRSTQEAMAVGRAVITTDVPGCRDSVISGKNGLIIPPGDVNALVEAMKFFINKPKNILSMGYESHIISKKLFSSKVFNQKLIKELKT